MHKILIPLILTLFSAKAYAGPAVIWGSPYPIVLGKGGIRFQNSDTTTTCNAAAAGSIRYNAGTFEGCNGSAWSLLSGSGSGTVTSVAATVPAFLSVAGSPITTSGTLAITLSGTALPAINGGTGQTGYTTGDLLYASSSTALSKLAIGTSGQVLTVAAGLPSWATSSGSALSSLTAAVASNTINNVANLQEWQWNSLASGNGMKFSTTAVGSDNNFVVVQSASTSSATGLLVNMTGTTGNQGGGTFLTVTNGSPVTVNVLNNGATNTGTAINAHNASTAGGSAIDADVSVAGSGNGFRLYNKGTAAANNGFGMLFHAHRTGSNDTQIARISGSITDIDNANYKGALIFYTARAATPTEHMRLDNAGHVIYTGTAPTITANCGTSPSVVGNDEVGRITVGTGGVDSSCTLTFAVAWGTAPVCSVNNETTITLAAGWTPTTTTLVISSVTPFTAGDKLAYHCNGF